MRAAPAVLAVLLATAGCLAVPAVVDAPPVPVAPPARLALEPGGLLAPEAAGSAEDVPLDWGWRQWLDGTPPPAWASEPAGSSFLVTEATATILYVADEPVLTAGTRPELTVWFGVDEAVVHHAFADGPPALGPGDEFEAVFELELPVGGLVVPAGGRIVLAVGTYYTDDAGAGRVSVRVGGDASRVDLVAAPLALPPAAPSPLLAESGAVEGGRCLGTDALTERDMVSYEFDVPATAAGVSVVLDRTGGTGPGDLDLAILGPDGEVVTRGQGPGPHEEAHVREPNVAAAGAGTWTLLVYSCTAQAGTFDVSASLLTPA